jgi:hypothetical protein
MDERMDEWRKEDNKTGQSFVYNLFANEGVAGFDHELMSLRIRRHTILEDHAMTRSQPTHEVVIHKAHQTRHSLSHKRGLDWNFCQ